MVEAAGQARDLVTSKRAVLFDLFHTLTAVEFSPAAALPRTHELLGVSREAWHEQLLEKTPERLVSAGADPVAIMTKMARALDPAISDARIRAAVENRMRCFGLALEHMPAETLATLRTLKARGKKLGLVSNADTLEAAGWSRCPSAALFDAVVFSCREGVAKPDPRIYALCLGRLGVPAAEAVFVGDGGADELRGARRAGLTAVLTTGFVERLWPAVVPERAPLADLVIGPLSDLV